jgi:hypothetical protein
MKKTHNEGPQKKSFMQINKQQNDDEETHNETQKKNETCYEQINNKMTMTTHKMKLEKRMKLERSCYKKEKCKVQKLCEKTDGMKRLWLLVL